MLQGARERCRVSGRGRARSGADGTVSAGRAAELAGLWRFENVAAGNGMEGWAALVVGGLSRREGSRVDGHAGEIGRLPAGEKRFMGIFKTPNQLEVANDILLHGGDCTRISVWISSNHRSLHLPTVAAYGGLLVRVTVHDEVGQVKAPLHLVSRVSDRVGQRLTWWHRTRLSFNAWHLALNAVLFSSVRIKRVCSSYRLCSRLAIRTSATSGTGSAGVPGWETLDLWGAENESR